MTDQQKVREAFESWITSRSWYERLHCNLKQTSDGNYCNYKVNDRWVAWQAALAHASSATVKENLTVGEGEEVAWRWRDDVRPGLPWRTTPDGEVMEKLRAAGCYEIEPLYTHPAPSAEDTRDAARYRWLRENVRTEGRGYRMPEVGTDQVLIRPLHLRFYIDTNGTKNDTLDKAIDQALAAERGEGNEVED